MGDLPYSYTPKRGENTMSTYMPKASDISRKWYVIDAEGKSLGRVAAAAATILRGKNKPTFAPHADCGDHVVIINCAKAVLTGKKLENKVYQYHTGWIGGLKTVKYSDMMANNPEKAMMLAVGGMLPGNTLGRKSLTRLRVYAGNTHEQTAQKPEAFKI
jgi:large subunit ribosomal protein L13